MSKCYVASCSQGTCTIQGDAELHEIPCPDMPWYDATSLCIPLLHVRQHDTLHGAGLTRSSIFLFARTFLSHIVQHCSTAAFFCLIELGFSFR